MCLEVLGILGILSSNLQQEDIYIDLAHRCPYLLLPKGVWGGLAASVVVWVCHVVSH